MKFIYTIDPKDALKEGINRYGEFTIELDLEKIPDDIRPIFLHWYDASREKVFLSKSRYSFHQEIEIMPSIKHENVLEFVYSEIRKEVMDKLNEWNDLKKWKFEVENNLKNLDYSINQKANFIFSDTKAKYEEIEKIKKLIVKEHSSIVKNEIMNRDYRYLFVPDFFLEDEEIKKLYEDRKHQYEEDQRRYKLQCEEENLKKRKEDENDRYKILELIKQEGTQDQYERFERGYLPKDEFDKIIRPIAFAPLNKFPIFKKITKDEILDVAASSDYPNEYEDYDRYDVEFDSDEAREFTADEFEVLKQIENCLKKSNRKFELEATEHRGGLANPDLPWVIKKKSVKVIIDFHGYVYTRRYALTIGDE